MNDLSPMDIAPDWALQKADLLCPLCGYNLRGLEQARCPECGFSFQWSELVRGQEQKHPYLFEHQSSRNIWSFWKTYSRNWRPDCFWMEVSPANPVRICRLIAYWIFSFSGLLAALILPVALNFREQFRITNVHPSPVASLASFFDAIVDLLYVCGTNRGHLTLICDAMIVIAWPWLTLVLLMVFVQSMRQAGIKMRHVLRVTIYSCDFSLLMLLVTLVGCNATYASRYPLCVALCCAAITLFRATIAYRQYMRFHLPLLTVLTTQLIMLMIMVIVYQNGLHSHHRF